MCPSLNQVSCGIDFIGTTSKINAFLKLADDVAAVRVVTAELSRVGESFGRAVLEAGRVERITTSRGDRAELVGVERAGGVPSHAATECVDFTDRAAAGEVSTGCSGMCGEAIGGVWKTAEFEVIRILDVRIAGVVERARFGGRLSASLVPCVVATEGIHQTDQRTACTVSAAGGAVLDVAATTERVATVVVWATEKVFFLVAEDLQAHFTGDLDTGDVPFHFAAVFERERTIALRIEQADGVRTVVVQATGCAVDEQAVSSVVGAGDFTRSFRAEGVPLDVAAERFEFAGQRTADGVVASRAAVWFVAGIVRIFFLDAGTDRLADEILIDRGTEHAKVTGVLDSVDGDRYEREHTVAVDVRTVFIHASVGKVDEADQVEFVDQAIRQRRADEWDFVASDVTTDEKEFFRRCAGIRKAREFKIGVELKRVEAITLCIDFRGHESRLEHGTDENHERHQRHPSRQGGPMSVPSFFRVNQDLLLVAASCIPTHAVTRRFLRSGMRLSTFWPESPVESLRRP